MRKKATAALGMLMVIVVAATAVSLSLGATPLGFTFSSNTSAVKYECSLDGTAFKPCSSPYDPALKAGKHTLDVWATFTVPSTTSTTSKTTTASTTTASAHCYMTLGACGYPDPKYGNVGATSSCSSLKASGGLTASTSGQTINGLNISGHVIVTASNVTFNNDCITYNGGGTLGARVLTIERGATNTHIDNSTIAGANSTTGAIEEALSNNNAIAGAVADHDYVYNCGECVHGAWSLTNSYVTSNASIPSEHYEDVYCNDTTFTANHDVLINPHEQTANLFCDTNGGHGGAADDHITVTNSLLAGSGFSLYPQGNASSVGSSTMNISNDRFARCLTSKVYNSSSGGTTCKSGPDTNGIYPYGGYYGTHAYTFCSGTGQLWSKNVWDDNGSTISC